MYNPVRGLRRHSNADIITKTKLTFGEHPSQSGLCSLCAMCGVCEVGRRAKTGQALFPELFGDTQLGAEKILPNLEDLQLIPELYGENIHFPNVSTACKIGSFECTLPLSGAAMGSTKVAHSRGTELATGCARAGIPMVIGENVFITYGKKGLKERMKPYLDNYRRHGALVVQANAEDRRLGVFEMAKELGAHALEVKLGQGAKQGMGGEIKFTSKEDAARFKNAGYTVVKNPDGSFQRHASPGSLSDKELTNTILKYSELDLPIWVKIGIGKGMIKLIKTLDRINKEHGRIVANLTIDGFGGGTGMSPWLVMNEHCIPSASVFSALEFKPSFNISLAGGYTNGADIAKGMLLGANAISMGRPLLIAVSAKEEKTKKQLGAHGIVNYANALKDELRMICATQKVKSVQDLKGKKGNLFALTDEAANMFGISKDTKKVL